MVDAISIGKRVRKLRKKRGIKQRELAVALGLQISAYSKRENGWIQFSHAELAMLSEFFFVSIDYLVTGKGEVIE